MFDVNAALFNSLNDCELEALAKHTKLKVLGKQQYLLAQHSSPDYVYNVESGVAAVERISSDGRRQILGFVFHGDFVGLTKTDHYEYAVKSLTALTAHQFRRRTLETLCEQYPKIDENLKNISSLVMVQLLNQLYLLGQKKARERLCFLLMNLLKRMPGARIENVDLPMTRLDIADYLGLTVETVSRSMTKLKQEGLVDITGPHSLAIIDFDAVQDLADIE